jgi:hypothetical protein
MFMPNDYHRHPESRRLSAGPKHAPVAQGGVRGALRLYLDLNLASSNESSHHFGKSFALTEPTKKHRHPESRRFSAGAKDLNVSLTKSANEQRWFPV